MSIMMCVVVRTVTDSTQTVNMDSSISLTVLVSSCWRQERKSRSCLLVRDKPGEMYLDDLYIPS